MPIVSVDSSQEPPAEGYLSYALRKDVEALMLESKQMQDEMNQGKQQLSQTLSQTMREMTRIQDVTEHRASKMAQCEMNMIRMVEQLEQ